MIKLLKKLFDGKKTYVTGGALVGLGVMVAMGYTQLPEETREGLAMALAGGMAVFLRMGLDKASGKLPAKLEEKAKEEIEKLEG